MRMSDDEYYLRMEEDRRREEELRRRYEDDLMMERRRREDEERDRVLQEVQRRIREDPEYHPPPGISPDERTVMGPSSSDRMSDDELREGLMRYFPEGPDH